MDEGKQQILRQKFSSLYRNLIFFIPFTFRSDLGENKIGRILKISFRDLANVATL